MRPGELIIFLLAGAALLAVILISWVIFRKRKKWAIVLTAVLVVGYTGFYLYFPTLKVNMHAKRYEQVIQYLAENYPNQEFTIIPEHFEEGYRVGQFRVNDRKTPMVGVTLRVDKKGQVTQGGTWGGVWTNREYPSQRELWQELEYTFRDDYTLDMEIAEVTKQDEWIDGSLTVFALTIDNMPTIAIFTYSSGGYGLLDIQQGAHEGFVFIEHDGNVFIYIDERYQEETITIHLENREDYTLKTEQNKGRLIVEKY